jgi:hypothetical protein
MWLLLAAEAFLLWDTLERLCDAYVGSKASPSADTLANRHRRAEFEPQIIADLRPDRRDGARHT